MAYKNRRLLDLAHEMPCMARFPHRCQGSVVPCHANGLEWGRGHGHRSDDIFFAACCQAAHDFIDGRAGGWTKEEKRSEWLRAYIETQRFIWTEGKVKVA